MSNLIDNLIDVLQDEINLYKKALDLSVKKTDILVRNNTEELNEITNEEEKLLLEIREVDKVREEIIFRIAEKLSADRKKITVSFIEKYVKGERLQSLQSAKKTLVSLVNELKKTNETNSMLIKQSMEYADFMMNLIVTEGNEDLSYDRKGIVNSSGQTKKIIKKKI